MVIDSDAGNEIDDQFALAYALNASDQVETVAVYAAPFATSRFSVADRVRHALEECGRVVSLCNLREPPTLLPGADAYLPTRALPATSPAADHLIALASAPATVAASEAGRPLYVVVIGCTTNIAAALLLAPEIAGRIAVVGDAAYPHHWPWRNRSYNLEQDVRAARVLFDRAPLVYIPGYQVAEQLTLMQEEAEQQVTPCGELGAFLWQLFPRCHPRQACSHVMWDIGQYRPPDRTSLDLLARRPDPTSDPGPALAPTQLSPPGHA